jgi:GT2 family glycosyltransferase
MGSITDMAGYPSVSVIILNWNGRAFLPDCLAALQVQEYPHFQVTLVDNASTDDSVHFVQTYFPQITIRVNERNVGFAAGNNVALRDETADFAVLLNPDVIVTADWLRQLIAPFLADKTIGVAGCKLRYPGGTLLNHVGGRITHPQAMPRHIGGKETDVGQHDSLRDVEYVIGAALAVRREILPQTGLFDEGYFLYFEDADFCFTVRKAGFRVVVVPQAVATHVESAVAEKGSFSYLERFHSGRWRFLLKHFSPDEILFETLPAERLWLEAIDPTERQAAALAYEKVSATLPSIWQIREADSCGALSPVRLEIEAGVEKLQSLARELSLLPDAASEWMRRSANERRPFASQLPLLSSLLTRVRVVWNKVASRWFTC